MKFNALNVNKFDNISWLNVVAKTFMKINTNQCIFFRDDYWFDDFNEQLHVAIMNFIAYDDVIVFVVCFETCKLK